jgi:hypothetical protein
MATSTSASASGEVAARNGRQWISNDASTFTTAVKPVPLPIVKHSKTHAQLVNLYTEYYHHWTDLSVSASSTLEASKNINDNAALREREEVERRRKWSKYYADNSAALAHYHLALSQGREPSGGVSMRPESPPMPPQMMPCKREAERMEANEIMSDISNDSVMVMEDENNIVVTSNNSANNIDRRKRKEIVGHSNADLGERLWKNESLTNATISKKLKKSEDNIVVALTATSPANSTQPTKTEQLFTQASRLQNDVIHAPSSSLPSPNTQSRLNHSGQKMQTATKEEKRTATNHVRHHPIDNSLRIRTNDRNSVAHHAQKMNDPDTHSVTAMINVRKRRKKKKKPNNRRLQREEGGDTLDGIYPTKWWTTILTSGPLLVVAGSLSTIFLSSSTAQLPSLLLSLTIIITLLPFFGMLFLPPMTTTAATRPNPIRTPTLREFLSHPDGFHLSFAPAFFGFFAYFGCLAALEEETNGRIVPKSPSSSITTAATATVATAASTTTDTTTSCGLQSVSGASAGAMAAVMLASGIQPRIAAQFASTFTWKMIADPPGLGGYVRGNNFEEVMRKFILEAGTRNTNIGGPPTTATTEDNNNRVNAKSIQLEESLVPVAVSAFDLLRMKGINMTRGCMAKAARCSAGFPGLFQPVAWRNKDVKDSLLPDFLLIDGGITDTLGLNGLRETITSREKKAKRVVNMIVGDFGFRGPRGLKTLPPGVNVEYLVSIAIIGTPLCGPWAMQNGPRAVESARKAMTAALDLPMERGTCDNHFVIRVEASKWLE